MSTKYRPTARSFLRAVVDFVTLPSRKTVRKQLQKARAARGSSSPPPTAPAQPAASKGSLLLDLASALLKLAVLFFVCFFIWCGYRMSMSNGMDYFNQSTYSQASLTRASTRMLRSDMADLGRKVDDGSSRTVQAINDLSAQMKASSETTSASLKKLADHAIYTDNAIVALAQQMQDLPKALAAAIPPPVAPPALAAEPTPAPPPPVPAKAPETDLSTAPASTADSDAFIPMASSFKAPDPRRPVYWKSVPVDANRKSKQYCVKDLKDNRWGLSGADVIHGTLQYKDGNLDRETIIDMNLMRRAELGGAPKPIIDFMGADQVVFYSDKPFSIWIDP